MRKAAILCALVSIILPSWADEVIDQPLRTLQQSGSVTSAAVSPDGLHILGSSVSSATTSCVGELTLWDLLTGEALIRYGETIAGEPRCPLSVTFSPDGERILTGNNDGTLTVWDTETGVHLRTFGDHADAVQSVAFSTAKKSARAASGSSDNTAKLWDTSTGALLTTYPHGDRVWSVAFSDTGNLLVTGGGDLTAKLWDVNEGTLLRTFQGHSDWVVSVAYLKQKKLTYVLTASLDRTVKLWNAETGELVRTYTHVAEPWTVGFSPDGDKFAAGLSDGTVRIWAVEGETKGDGLDWDLDDNGDGVDKRAGASRTNHTTMDHPILKIEAHDKEIRSTAYTPSGKHLVTGSDDGSIRTWQADESDIANLQAVPVSDGLSTVSDRFQILDAYPVPDRKLRVDGIDTMNDALTGAAANVLAIGRNQFVGLGRSADSEFRDINSVIVLYDFDGAPHIVAQTNRKESKIELLGFIDGVLFVHLPKARQIVRITGDWGTGVFTSESVSSPDMNRDGRVDSMDLMLFNPYWHVQTR